MPLLMLLRFLAALTFGANSKPVALPPLPAGTVVKGAVLPPALPLLPAALPPTSLPAPGARAAVDSIRENPAFSAAFSGEASKREASLPILFDGEKPAKPESVEGAETLWTELENFVRSPLKLNGPFRAREWERLSIEKWRNRPALPLEQVLAESLSHAYSLPLSDIERVRAALPQGLVLEPESSGPTHVDEMIRHEGKEYALGSNGLWVKDYGRWTREVDGLVWGLQEFEGNLYAKREGRLIKKGKDGWKSDGFVSEMGHGYAPPEYFKQLIRLKGEISIVGRGRLEVYKQGQWTPSYSNIRGELTTVVEKDGGLYAGTDDGIYIYKPDTDAWERLLACAGVYDLVDIGGKLHAATGSGLYIQKNHKWELLLDAPVVRVVESEGRLYAGTRQGIQARGGDGSWREATRFYVGAFYPYFDSQYLSYGGDLRRWSRLPDSLQDWKERLAAAIGREMARADEAPVGNASFSAAADGSIKNKGGRSIFNGLAQWLGGSHLDFPQPDRWAELESELLALSGAAAPSRTALWKAETADILRNHPDKELLKAMAQGFSNVHHWAAPPLKLLSELFSRYTITEVTHPIPRIDYYLRLFALDGQVFLAPDRGLYRYDSGNWKVIEGIKGHVRDLAKLDGVLYAATLYGGYRQEADGVWKMIFMKDAYHVGMLEGRLYIDTVTGLYVQSKLGIAAFFGLFFPHMVWRPIWASLSYPKTIHHFAVHGDAIYVSTGDGLYEGRRPRRGYLAAALDGIRLFCGLESRRFEWKKIYSSEIRYPISIYDSTRTQTKPDAVHWSGWINGELHIATESGLYARRDGTWRMELGGDTHKAIEHAGRLFVSATDPDVYVKEADEWKKIPELGWARELASDGRFLYAAAMEATRILFFNSFKQSDFLEDVAQALAQQASFPAGSSSLLEPAANGSVKGNGGRVIFDGGRAKD